MVLSCCVYGCKQTFNKNSNVSFHVFPKDPMRRKAWSVKLKRENSVPTNHSRICSRHFKEDCFDVEKFGGRWLKPTAKPTIFDFSDHLQDSQKDKKTSGNCLSVSPLIVIPKKEPNDETSQVHLVPKSSENSTNPSSTSSNPPLFYSGDCKITAVYSLSEQSDEKREVHLGSHNTENLTDKSTMYSRRRLFYLGDYKDSIAYSQSEQENRWKLAKSVIEQQKKKLSHLQLKNRRLQKKVFTLTTLLNKLKRKDLISEPVKDSLEVALPEAAANLVKRATESKSKNKYTPELKHFAQTLYCCSEKAYNYVRKNFNTCLPHPATLRKWCNPTDEKTDFTHESVGVLKTREDLKKINESSAILS